MNNRRTWVKNLYFLKSQMSPITNKLREGAKLAYTILKTNLIQPSKKGNNWYGESDVYYQLLYAKSQRKFSVLAKAV